MNRAVFLDRDGVINKSIVRDGKPYPPSSLAEFQFVDGIAPALLALKKRGYLLLVFTNQPDVASGLTTREEVEALHERITSSLPIDKVYCCYHNDAAHCDCRKPKPGMILQGAVEFDVALDQSYAVGDRWRDIDAGNAAGCKTIFVDYGYREALRSAPWATVKIVPDILQHIAE